MSKKNVRVVLPVRSLQLTIELAQAIVERHQNLGAGSPLSGNPIIAAFTATTATAADIYKQATKSRADAEASYNALAVLCGIAQGQNLQAEGTLNWHLVRLRELLLVRYRGLEETLTTFGFHVVISQRAGRRYLRVPLSIRNPAKMIDLAKKVWERHTELGASSPLNDPQADAGAFQTVLNKAELKLRDYKNADAEAQALHGEAQKLVGFAAGQTSLTEGTLYYMLCLIRDHLLMVYMGIEEELTLWGFHVLVRLSKPRKPKPANLPFGAGTAQ